MIRALLDTNVILDALLGRTPWDSEATAIFEANRQDRLDVSMTASSLTNIFYVARRLTDRERAWDAVRVCLDQLAILPVSASELRAAASGPGMDLEDNLQVACALVHGLDAIVTRDPKGLVGSSVAVLSPAELLPDSWKTLMPDNDRPRLIKVAGRARGQGRARIETRDVPGSWPCGAFLRPSGAIVDSRG